MHSAELLRLGAQALELVLRVSLPVLLASLVVGLLVGLGQAVTQVQDQTLSFVPKLLAVAATLALVGGSMGAEIARFTESIWLAIPTWVH
ncbi:MAG: type III secretion system export apparatus subunit SctS [Polyangiales bacterium]